MSVAVPRLVFGAWLGLASSSIPTTGAAGADGVPRMPMPVNEEQSIHFRWWNKAVFEARLLDDMEQTDRWSHEGEGKMAFTRERARDGKQSVRLISPTKTAKSSPVVGRPFGECVVRRNFAGENWTDYNRLSFRVYPRLFGFNVISLLVKLHNNGVERVPDGYGREGLNYFLLKPDQWNQVVWEIPLLARDKVTAVDFVYRLQGNEPGAAEVVQFDIDQLELQRVEPDHVEGWEVATGQIAFSHTGYAEGGSKTAVGSRLKAKEFSVVRLATAEDNIRRRRTPAMDKGKTVLTKQIKSVTTELGGFQWLDFSEVLEPGVYALKAGETATPPFLIHPDVWRDTIWKTINLFYCERCGDRIAGIHDVCHRDWQAVHGGRTIFINGGWHDAGDLSQSLVNTAEAAHAMFSLAERMREEDPALAKRLIEEAKWGLAWVHKTHFGDGSRMTWATMDFWTDGRLGTVDDVKGEVDNSPFDNFLAAAVEAIAARVLKEGDSKLAERSLQLAREDWRFAVEKMKSPGLEPASAGAQASLELFRATGEMSYATRAIELANVILQCQQREWTDWQIPLTGFFYTDSSRTRILHYNHRGHEQAPIVALVELCETFPEHADWTKWYSAVALHSEYLKRIAKFTEPYAMLPASIYSLDESNERGFRDQVLAGIKLSDKRYLRRFPVWFEFRGNHGTVLSQTKALSAAAQLRRDLESVDLAQKQLQWVVGRNPFCQSTMYGEGYDYAPQYTAMSGDMVGSLPVGIQTRQHRDVPYWPAANCYNYKEVWVHPSSRWLAIMEDLAGPATVTGEGQSVTFLPVEFEHVKSGKRFQVKPDGKTGKFAAKLPEGQYVARHEGRQRRVTLLPGENRYLDLRKPLDIEFSANPAPNDSVTIKLRLEGDGTHHLALRAHNLQVSEAGQAVELRLGAAKTVHWAGKIIDPKEPWVAVIVPDGNLKERLEILDRRFGPGERQAASPR